MQLRAKAYVAPFITMATEDNSEMIYISKHLLIGVIVSVKFYRQIF
jgi:hypothetical protein